MTRALRRSTRPTTAWTTTRGTCTSLEHALRARNLCHTLFILSHMHLMAQDLSLVINISIVIHVNLSLSSPLSSSASICPSPSSPFSFNLLHFELHTELDNLITMQNLRTSANKESNDAYDVHTSLTDDEGINTDFWAHAEAWKDTLQLWYANSFRWKDLMKAPHLI